MSRRLGSGALRPSGQVVGGTRRRWSANTMTRRWLTSLEPTTPSTTKVPCSDQCSSTLAGCVGGRSGPPNPAGPSTATTHSSGPGRPKGAVSRPGPGWSRSTCPASGARRAGRTCSRRTAAGAAGPAAGGASPGTHRQRRPRRARAAVQRPLPRGAVAGQPTVDPEHGHFAWEQVPTGTAPSSPNGWPAPRHNSPATRGTEHLAGTHRAACGRHR
jgi:hypothetical protein